MTSHFKAEEGLYKANQVRLVFLLINDILVFRSKLF